MSEIVEVVQTLDRLNAELQDLMVRGLRVCGPESLLRLRGLYGELDRVGAAHVAQRLQTLINAIEADDRASAAALLKTQASLRVFERVLTVRVVSSSLSTLIDAVADDGHGDLGEDDA